MKTPVSTLALVLGILAAVFVVHPSTFLLSQGALTPPGAPAPTMKTLDQIEPRTPISTLPFTISSPGSYYLTGNLTATADGNAITVAADNVTLDLNGFTLAGGGTGSRRAILISGFHFGICVRNGTMSGWTNLSIASPQASGVIYENLRLVSNVLTGAILAGSSTTVRGCTVTFNNGSSIEAINIGSNSSVSDCVVSNNGFVGLHVGADSTITNCTASGNAGTGIMAEHGCTIVNCTANNNGGSAGISAASASTVAHCTANNNGSGTGITTGDDSTISDCTAWTNFNGMTVTTGCTVSQCTIAKSGQNGLTVFSRCHVKGCTFENNNLNNGTGLAGLAAGGAGNRIDSNHFAANNYAGLVVSSAGSLIIRNTFSGAQYIVAPGNSVGPTIDMTAGGTISSTSGTSGPHPWANIVY